MNPKSLMNQTVSIYAKSTYDKYGRETYSGSPTSVQSRFQFLKTTENQTGGEVQTVQAIAYVPADTSVSINDRLDYDSISYRVLNVYKQFDGQGTVNHIKIELTKWTV